MNNGIPLSEEFWWIIERTMTNTEDNPLDPNILYRAYQLAKASTIDKLYICKDEYNHEGSVEEGFHPDVINHMHDAIDGMINDLQKYKNMLQDIILSRNG